ncbi:MAG: methyltransferase domain-containing protein [Planctomycetales bacterium]|nr:methyltransferase domain-containing protein [Planctomycetales bacterium]
MTTKLTKCCLLQFRARCLPLLLLAVVVASGGTAQGQVATAEPAARAENLPKGINDSFLDPEMKVEDYVNRFETESREVFACRQQILAAVHLEPGMAVADVGSGTGLYLGAFSRAVGPDGQVYAVDIAPNFIKYLRQRATDEGLKNVQVVLCSDRDVNLKPGSIDRAFICDVYHHFEYPASSLKSIYQALRPGGQLILVDFHREVDGERKEWLFNHIRAPQSVFKQEILDAGFKFEEEVSIDGFKENYFLRFSRS